MRSGVARRRSGGVDAATAALLDEDSRLRNVSGNFTLHVLVASGSDGPCDQEPCETTGENVVVTETRVRIPLGPPTCNELSRLALDQLIEGERASEAIAASLVVQWRHFRVFDAPASTMPTRAGEPGDEFFLILDGTASVDVAKEKRGPLRPGAFFGEMSLLDGGPRSATIVAETPVRLLVISRRNFFVLLKDVPGPNQSLLVTLSRRVRQAEESAERMGGASAGL